MCIYVYDYFLCSLKHDADNTIIKLNRKIDKYMTVCICKEIFLTNL